MTIWINVSNIAGMEIAFRIDAISSCLSVVDVALGESGDAFREMYYPVSQ